MSLLVIVIIFLIVSVILLAMIIQKRRMNIAKHKLYNVFAEKSGGSSPLTGELKPKTIRFADHPEFTPNLTPRQIFKLGSFGGTYWRPIKSGITGKNYKNKHLKYPKSWWRGIPEEHLTSPDCNPRINRYKVKSGTSLRYWEKKKWIRAQDPYGWVQWYCEFYNGRRSADDKRQIGRWQKFAGPKGRFRLRLINMIRKRRTWYNDYTVSPVIRQGLQHWAYCLTSADMAASGGADLTTCDVEDFSIRDIKREDIKQAKKLVNDYQLSLNETPQKLSAKAFWDIAAVKHHTLVYASKTGKIIGLITFGINENTNVAKIRLITVAEEARGCGIGDELMTEAIRCIREKSSAEIKLDVEKKNRLWKFLTEKFYPRYGFEIYNNNEKYTTMKLNAG